MNFTIRTFVIVFVLAAMVGTSGMVKGQAGDQSDQPMIGQPAPPFSLKTLEGDTIVLSDLRGKFVVIHFAASW